MIGLRHLKLITYEKMRLQLNCLTARTFLYGFAGKFEDKNTDRQVASGRISGFF
jgi:hypothetical protein